MVAAPAAPGAAATTASCSKELFVRVRMRFAELGDTEDEEGGTSQIIQDTAVYWADSCPTAQQG